MNSWCGKCRGAIVNRDDVVEMLKSGHLAGYAGGCSLPSYTCSSMPLLRSVFRTHACGSSLARSRDCCVLCLPYMHAVGALTHALSPAVSTGYHFFC